MSKYLPSKKFIIFILSIIFALGLIYTPSLLKRDQTRETITSEQNIKNERQKLPDNDTDGDGLKDWEETLYGTDTNNPDTDGDRTNDSIEIKEKRDPLVANTSLNNQEPNDKLTTEIITALKEGVADFETLSTTDRISRELLLQYINTKKAGTELTEAEKNSIIDKAFSYLPEFNFKTYNKKDIRVSSVQNPESLRIYANDIAKIILDNLKTETESIEKIIADTGEIEDEINLNKEIEIIFQRFTPLIEKNKKTTSDLLKINVPEIFSDQHLELLNSFTEIYEKLDLMQKSADDFIVVIILKSQYSQSVDRLAVSLQKITETLIASQITFTSENDFGYQLFNVIMSLP